MTYIPNSDFYVDIQKDNWGGHTIVHKYGLNRNIPNGTFNLVSLLGGVTTFLAAPTTVRIAAGGNAADTAAGAGARSVTVSGIDSTLALASEDIVTAGAAASLATTTSFWRVFRGFPLDVGTYGGSNTGAITIQNSGGGTNLLQIAAGLGQSQHAAYTVPDGTTAYVLGAEITVDANKAADIRFYQRRNFNDTTAPMPSKRIVLERAGVLGRLPIEPKAPYVFPGLTDLWWEASGGGAATTVSVDFWILLVT